MTEQTSLWKTEQQSFDFAELSNALYERELSVLANTDNASIPLIQGRLKSLPYYIKRTAHLMLQCDTPLDLDVQNASWSAKQIAHMPLTGQDTTSVNKWYSQVTLQHGLVVPVVHHNHIALDCVDRIDHVKHRFRTNVHGWFNYAEDNEQNEIDFKLLKPNKKVMTAACSGHCWVNEHRSIPVMPTLREMLLSCTINWRNFKKPVSNTP
jgi:hypothetical protein